MLKIAFSKHPLIKISMAYAYIKPEVRKKNTVPITTRWADFSGRGTRQIFGYHGEKSRRISPIRKTLRSVLVLLTVVTLKIVSESIYFQSNIFIGCKVKDGKEVAQSLMVLNLLKIIHPFQGIYRVQKEKKI